MWRSFAVSQEKHLDCKTFTNRMVTTTVMRQEANAKHSGMVVMKLGKTIFANIVAR